MKPYLLTILAVSLVTTSASAAPLCSSSEIGGLIYRDYNSNGALDILEPGVSNVSVTAYNASNQIIDETKSNENGEYKLNVPLSIATRVEFTNIPEFLKSGPVGVDSSTTVQFISAGNCQANLALHNPAQHCDSDPNVAIPCYIAGDPLASGSFASNADVFVTFPYSARGKQGEIGTPHPTHAAVGKEIGSAWGVTYQRSSSTIFTSAFMKRHSGFGPLGTGGIYGLDNSNPATPIPFSFLDLQSLGINTGVDPRVSGDLSTDPLPYEPLLQWACVNFGVLCGQGQPSPDPYWDLVGKMSLGAIAISDDERTLYVVNLFDKTLYGIEIGVPFTSPTLNDVTAYPISNPGCSFNDFRPFATTVQDGKVYVGVTCTAETSQNLGDLKAYILTLDETSKIFTPVLEIDLNYPRGIVAKGPDPACSVTIVTKDAEWRPWTSDWSAASGVDNTSVSCPNAVSIINPQPILSDIGFLENGNLVFALTDRVAHSFGGLEPTPLGAGDLPLTAATSAGDILLACRDANGNFELEQNGGCTGQSPSAGMNTNQGP
ncbi:MAG: hypothetical protein KDD53_09065, partial [Bdellovibrionales bacterium]|nr:hypothetical protein [Bdellovibrionales bacterium]